MSPVPRHNPGPEELPPHPGNPYGQTPLGPPARSRAEMVQIRRDLFWQNVVREILLGLAAAAAESGGRLGLGAADAASGASPISEMFDGRMGLITVLGQRIPIADVVPVFSCSAAVNPAERMLSDDVQCTVFRIRTPAGENYTLPIHQIVGVHSMSDQLADQLEEAARRMEETDEHGNRMPFGFAAYTSLARAEQGPREPGERPDPRRPEE